jgi:hypothetical protein
MVLDICDDTFPYDLAIYDALDRLGETDCKMDPKVRMLVEEISNLALEGSQFGDDFSYRTTIHTKYKLDMAECYLYWEQYKFAIIIDDESIYLQNAYKYCSFDELKDIYFYEHQLAVSDGYERAETFLSQGARGLPEDYFGRFSASRPHDEPFRRSLQYEHFFSSPYSQWLNDLIVRWVDMVDFSRSHGLEALGRMLLRRFWLRLSPSINRKYRVMCAFLLSVDGYLRVVGYRNLLLLTFLGLLTYSGYLLTRWGRYRRYRRRWLKARRNKHLVDHLRPIVLGRRRDQKLLLTCFRHSEDWFRTMAFPDVPGAIPQAIVAQGGYVRRSEFRRFVAASVAQALHVGRDERRMRFILGYRGDVRDAFQSITGPS